MQAFEIEAPEEIQNYAPTSQHVAQNSTSYSFDMGSDSQDLPDELPIELLGDGDYGDDDDDVF